MNDYKILKESITSKKNYTKKALLLQKVWDLYVWLDEFCNILFALDYTYSPQDQYCHMLEQLLICKSSIPIIY